MDLKMYQFLWKKKKKKKKIQIDQDSIEKLTSYRFEGISKTDNI